MSLECYYQIEKFFRDKTGITFQEKLALFFIKLSDLMNRLEFYDCYEFYHRLQNDEKIFLYLLRELVVSRSYFFREKGDFSLLKELIREDNITHPHILSMPCANGEEPYSIAIFLLEHGIEHFNIDAVDINPEAITKAREGVYGARELYYFPENLKRKYFIQIKDSYKIAPFLQKYISFYQANLFEYERKKKYDYIFCRNLFIYLDEAKKEEALTIFYSLLKSKGYLFVSFSDYLKTSYAFDKITVNNKIIYKKVDRK